MRNVCEFLNRLGIAYRRYEHPPVYTMQDVEELGMDIPGRKSKNLLLRDEKGKRHFLVVVSDDQRVDLKRLSATLNVKRLGFASARRLKELLGVDPGAVSLLGVINDAGQKVEVIMDRTLWQSDFFQFHPLVNTATLVLSQADIQRFSEAADHEIRLEEIPG